MRQTRVGFWPCEVNNDCITLRDRSLFMWGGGGGVGWGGPKENFTMIGGGSLCVENYTHYNSCATIHVEDLNKF